MAPFSIILVGEFCVTIYTYLRQRSLRVSNTFEFAFTLASFV